MVWEGFDGCEGSESFERFECCDHKCEPTNYLSEQLYKNGLMRIKFNTNMTNYTGSKKQEMLSPILEKEVQNEHNSFSKALRPLYSSYA